MKIFTSLLLVMTGLVAASNVFAAGRVDLDALRVFMDHGNMNVCGRYQCGVKGVEEKAWVARGVYDFSYSGGAIGAISLLRSADNAGKVVGSTPLTLPKGAIVKNVLIDVITAPTSGGTATIALSTGESAADLKAATAYSSFTGVMAGVPVGTAATAIKLTADRTPTLTIGAAALTAGKINVLIEYLLSTTN